jgi:hypothetical protein
MSKRFFMKWTNLLAILLCLILTNCNKDKAPVQKQQDTNILTYSIQNTPAKIDILSSQHLINIRFPDSVMNANDLIAKFTLSAGCKASVKNIEQVSGVSKNNYAKIFFYTVSAAGNSTDWKVTASNNDYTAGLGLGNFIQQTESNNCSYSWYMDQAYTGPYSSVNCGPTAVTMACKWADPTFTKTPEDARKAIRPTGGDWYPDDITFYLRDNNIPNSTIALPATEGGTTQTIKRLVDLHEAVIVCLEMYYVRFNGDPNSHVDRFYTFNPGIGHFIIVKGYKEVDDETYFEVYDPNSWTRTYGAYNDGNFKGKDRYYRSEDLFKATKVWWPKVFVVAKKGTAVIE